jgi:predicted alpha-1,2-mannosidase
MRGTPGRRRTALLTGILATGLLLTLGVAPAAASPSGGGDRPVADPTTLVDPYVGTENYGNTFPGAAVPFGMVQVSPDTGGQGGYDYDQNAIYGFSQTHLSGVGCGVEGELPLMPTTGAVSTVDPTAYASTYSHSAEQAHPGYYQVRLGTYGINAELTATQRTGLQRYTFPATTQANVLFNTGKANMSVFDSGLTIVGDDTVEGYVHDGNFCAGQDQHTVYFTAKFSQPFTGYGTWRDSTTTAGSRAASGSGGNGGWVTFDTTKKQAVTVAVGLSYTGIAGARENLAAETHGRIDFDRVRQQAHDTWQQALDTVRVAGNTAAQTPFYTALYHTLLHPNVFGDVDGRYAGFDGKIHQATDYTPYANFSLWDTYRTQNQLLELLYPQVARNIDLSLLAVYQQGGALPRWQLENSETNIMTGDPVTPFLVDGWSKGLLAGHEEEAYQAMLADVSSEPPADSPFNGRNGNPYYLPDGFIPSGENCVYKGGDNDCEHPASATLEYAAADASLSIMAKALGHTADATMLARRGENYTTIYDASIGFFRPRNPDGSWVTPYDPESGDDAFHESGAYQYQWLVPQDEPGLIAMLGGAAPANQRLDDFFDYSGLLTDPIGTVQTGWVNSPYGYYGNKTYNPNNETDLQSPYTYLWTGQPDHTATVVHAAETLFSAAPNGVTGNDDLGEMSSWLVMSSLGLYPVMSGAGYYAVTSPAFPQAQVSVGALHGHGSTLTINAPGVSWTNRYVTGLTVNGQPDQRTWLTQDQVAHGGRLNYTVAATPGTWGTAPADAPPAVTTPADR